MTSKLRWGIIGTGAIAKCFAENIGASETGTLAAVGSRSEASAKAFADNGDPRFSVDADEEYRHLFARILNLAPRGVVGAAQ